MRLLRLIFIIILWVYSIIFLTFIYILATLARLLERPEDITHLFDLTLIVHQMREIYESYPRYSAFVGICRRM